MSEKTYREPWHTILRVWVWLLPGAVILGIVGAILWLLYSWSTAAGIAVTVGIVWGSITLILGGLSAQEGNDGS